MMTCCPQDAEGYAVRYASLGSTSSTTVVLALECEEHMCRVSSTLECVHTGYVVRREDSAFGRLGGLSTWLHGL